MEILIAAVVMFGILPSLYAVFCSSLYVVYKLTGGKMGFWSWWKKMEF